MIMENKRFRIVDCEGFYREYKTDVISSKLTDKNS